MNALQNLKRRLCAAILGAILLVGILAVPAGAVSGPTLRVAFYPLPGFFEYTNRGEECGYGVDLLNLISRYTGITFTYVLAHSWEETKQMVLKGEADVRMPGTLPVSPSNTLGYTEHSIIDTYYAVMALKSREDLCYQDYETFQTLKVGISRPVYQSAGLENELEDAGIPAEHLVFYDGFNACRAALEAGEIDALISNVMDLDGEMKQLERFGTISNYISMSIGNPYLKTINNALAKIQSDEPTFFSDTYKRWFPERVAVPMTKDEARYLASINSLTFAFQDGRGYYSRREKDGSFTGFYPAVAQMICDRLGVSCIQTEWKEEKARGVVVYPDFYYDHVWADEKNVDITQPYATVNYYAIKNKNSSFDSETCTVAAVHSSHVTQNYILGKYRQDQITWCRDSQDCLTAVASGRASLALVSSYAAEYYLKMYHYSQLTPSLVAFSNRVCLGVEGDETGLLASALSKTLSTITTDELNALMIDTTVKRPSQNLLLAWIYENPVRSILIVSGGTILMVSLAAVFLYLKRAHRKNLDLAEAVNAKQAFLSRMSHDMRTPMNAIIGFSSFGAEASDLEESAGYHEKIHQAGQYLLQLINDSLDLSKLQSKNYALHPQPYRKEELLESLANLLQPRAQEKGVFLAFHCDPTLPPLLLFDKMRVQQIFVNLLNNAIKFTPSGGHVTLDIEKEDAGPDSYLIRFRVRDDGAGMSDEFQRNRLFKPFEQEHTTASGDGTGLGLAIVKDLVTMMGGTISCKSAPGKGTTFTVLLRGQIVPEQNLVEKLCPISSSGLAGKNVLVCEDQAVNREIVEKLLQHVGICVDSAENGQEGLKLFEKSVENYYFAVLMDIRMPVLDGISATKAIRRLSRRDAAGVPIIALSAAAPDENMVPFRAAELSGCLTKPIDPEELYAALAKYLPEDERQSPKSPSLIR